MTKRGAQSPGADIMFGSGTTLGRVAKTTKAKARRAALIACQCSADVDDARHLLDMLGVVEILNGEGAR